MAACKSKPYPSCVAGRCTLPARRLTSSRGGAAYYLLGTAGQRDRPASPCKVYYLDACRDRPPGRRAAPGWKQALSMLFRR